MPKITTFLTYDGRAEEAVTFYTSIFPRSRITDTRRYGDTVPGRKGSVLTMTFELDGKPFIALNGGPGFAFSMGISLFVECKTQAEVDELWEKLSAGGQKGQCGWLTDKFGVSWQVVPPGILDVVAGPDPVKADRAMRLMMTMSKLDIAALRRAHDGA